MNKMQDAPKRERCSVDAETMIHQIRDMAAGLAALGYADTIEELKRSTVADIGMTLYAVACSLQKELGV